MVKNRHFVSIHPFHTQPSRSHKNLYADDLTIITQYNCQERVNIPHRIGKLADTKQDYIPSKILTNTTHPQ